MKNLRFFLIVIVSVFSITVYASNSHLTDNEFLQKISVFNSINRQEKLYLHLNKPVFYAGEDIWFSAFLTDAKTNMLNATERVVYVELLKPNGRKATKQFFKVEKGRAAGSIALDENLLSGEYLLVAYTNWMRNSGSDFYFKEKIIVVNDSIPQDSVVVEGNSELNISAKINSDKSSADQQQQQSQVSLNFFPEGGALLEGISSKVAFEVLDNNGMPLAVAGSVVDESGNLVAALNTLWQGRGFFQFVPLANKKYHAVLNSGTNESLKFPLPEVATTGYSLVVESEYNSSNVLVTVTGAGDNSTGRFFLLAMQEQKPLYALADTLKSVGKTFSINTSNFKTGIVQFTLFDQYKKPQSERLLFVNKNDQLDLSVNVVNPSKGQRDNVSLELVAKDKDGTPVSGTFSLAVTDANRIDGAYYHPNEFVNHLFFGANIAGFKGDGLELLKNSRKGHLLSELVMLTNGWRRYSWKQVLKDTITMPSYLEEPGIYVKGCLYKKAGKEKLAPTDTEVSMLFPKRFDAYSQTIDKYGRFSFLVSDFYGTQGAVIQTRTQMNVKKDYLIDLQSNMKSDVRDIRSADKLKKNSQVDLLQFSSTVQIDNILAEREMLKKVLVRSLDNDFMMDTTDITLSEVDVVGAKSRVAKEKVIKRFGPPQQSIGKAQISDIIKKKSWYEGIIDVIEDAIPGLEVVIDYNTETDMDFIRFVPKNKSDHRFFVYVDGVMVGASNDKGELNTLLSLYSLTDLIGLDPAIVESIDLIFPPKEKSRVEPDLERNSYMSEIHNNTDIESSTPEVRTAELNKLADTPPTVYTSPPAILSIYTTNGGGLSAGTPFKGVLKVDITGFSRHKEFYSPNYKADMSENVVTDNRTTLYWNPMVTTDSTGKATIDFFNSDLGHLFRVDAVGLSANGTPGNILTQFGDETPLVVVPKTAVTAMPTEVVYSNDKVDLKQSWSDATKHPVSVKLADSRVAAFADVMVRSKSWGTTTDVNGLFYVDKSVVSVSDSLVISYRGDEALVIACSDLLLQKTISLKSASSACEEQNGSLIYKSALKAIFKNKSSSTTYGNAVYREQIYWDSELHRLTDIIYQLKAPSVKEVAISYGSIPQKGRIYMTEGYDNKSKFSPAVNTIFGIQSLDAFYQSQTFLNMSSFKQYEISFVGCCQYQNREMYRIAFDQKDGLLLSLSEGYILVDKLTNGIAYISWRRSSRGEKYLMADSYLLGGVFDKKFSLKTEFNQSVYQLINEEWYFKSGYQDVHFLLDGKNYSFNRECLVTDYLTEKPKTIMPFAFSEMEKRFLLIKEPNYEPSNWRSAWFLPKNNAITNDIPFMHEVMFLSAPQ